MGDRRILALTILQPWAELIVRGPKRVENRTWAPRGLRVGNYLALHAGRRLDADSWGGAVETARDSGLLGSLPVLDGLVALPAPERGDRFGQHREKHYAERACPYSAIVGVAKLVGVDAPGQGDTDPWRVRDQYGWRLGDVVAFERPVACRGAQGLWTLPLEVLVSVKRGWREATRG